MEEIEEEIDFNDVELSVAEDFGRHMPGGFFIYKAKEPGELIYANKACYEIFGCRDISEFTELTGFTFRGMVYPEDYDKINTSIYEQISSDVDDMDRVEYRILRKDGEIRWVDDYGHYTETKTYGGIYYVFISDITKKRAEREKGYVFRGAVIDTLTNAYHTLWFINDLDTEKCMLFHSDMDAVHSEVIKNALSHPKYTDTKTQYVNTMVAEEDRERMQEQISITYMRKQFESMTQYSVTFLRDLEEGPRYYRVDIGKVNMPDGKTGATMGFKDVDSEVRDTMAKNQALKDALHAAEQASKAKTAFLSSMSHEIRTPMNAIIGLNNLALGEKDLPEDIREYLVKIETAADHLLGIINDILDMSRIESGTETIKNEEFSLSFCLDQVNTIIGEQCQDKGLEYDFRTSGKIDENYIGDSMKLRQILINILGNSVKFTPEGGKVSLLVEEGQRFEHKAAIHFTISDTGIGISEEYLPHIFDAFSKEDVTVSNKYGSTGLGMSITKRLVDLMDGHIEVDSRKGEGTTFSVTVTLGEVPEESSKKGEGFDAAEASPVEEVQTRADLKGRRILLAEDMEINSDIMVMVLGMREIEADVAENGKIAVEKFCSHPEGYYDAILMDMRMPEMDGLQATRLIRSSGRKDAKSIPVIALTANAFDDDVRRSMQAGLNAHLSKPVEPEILFDTLETLIRP